MLFHLGANAGRQAATFGKLKKRRPLIDDVRDSQGPMRLAIGEAGQDGGVELAFGGGNRIAVRVDAGVAQVSVDAFEDFFRNGVFEQVGFLDESPTSRGRGF